MLEMKTNYTNEPNEIDTIKCTIKMHDKMHDIMPNMGHACMVMQINAGHGILMLIKWVHEQNNINNWHYTI